MRERASEKEHRALSASFVWLTGAAWKPRLFCTKGPDGAEVLHAVSGGRKLVFGDFSAGHWTALRTYITPAKGTAAPLDQAFEIVACST